MEQQYVIIGFSKAKGLKPFSWLIQLFENTEYSHTYIKLNNRHFNDFDIYQASKGMVNHLVEPTFLEENKVIAEFSIAISDEEKMKMFNFLRYKLGKPYSMWSVIGIFLQKFGIKSSWFFKDENSYICSELVAKALLASNKIPMTIDANKATPRQLFELCDLYTTRIK